MKGAIEDDLRRFEERRQEREARRRLWVGRAVYFGLIWLICVSFVPIVLLPQGSLVPVVIGLVFTAPAMLVAFVWSVLRFKGWAESMED